MRSTRPGPSNAAFLSLTTRNFADCGDRAHCDRGRRRLLSDRLSRRPGFGLDAGGRGRRTGGAAHEDTGADGAPVLRTGRYSAWCGGDAGHAQGNCRLAAECRASGHRGCLHDDSHRVLSARGARLGSIVGIARRQSGFDGAGDGAVGGVQGRCARNRHRARDARTLDRAWFARGSGAVRLNGGTCGVDARRFGLLVVRACDPGDGVDRCRARHVAGPFSRRPAVRCHGRFGISSRTGFGPCFAAVVGRAEPPCSRSERSRGHDSRIRVPGCC